MKLKLTPYLAFVLLCVLFATVRNASSAQRKAPAQAGKAKTTAGSKPEQPEATNAAGEEALKAELEGIVTLAPAERVVRLQAFLRKRTPQAIRLRALEQLTSARAALGDEKLRTGDRRAGVELFRLAVSEAPAEMSDKLFVEVVSQLPANLYILNEREAAFDLARRIEQKVGDNPQRLLSVATFYLGVEQPDDAARVAGAVVKLKPEMAVAHQALGASHRVALRLEEAASEYARAVELDPASKGARLSLADLRRATGKPEEALALYREQLAADAGNAGARTGLVLSLFDTGKREEAERELKSALDEQPNNLPLMVGAAYWYAAHGEGARAVELAERAVALEPRYRWVWSRITLARALLAQKRPLDAERALRPARELGRFPTMDYELASVLAAAGLYEEAADELSHSFTLDHGELGAQLAGHVRARAATFTELLAPERRASLFQFTTADTDENARTLKALLAFNLATRAAGGETKNAADEKEALAAANDFAAGGDEMRAFRQLYAAARLLRRGIGWQTVVELTEAAKGGVESALDVPHASVALLADELREVRSQAIAAGATTTAPNVSRDMLSKILRGRIEDLAGWALYNQGNAAESAVRLRRAVSVTPENSPWSRTALWHLGAALDASGNQKDALAAYVRAYRLAPDPARRLVVEALYRKMNGSLEGLDTLLGGTLAAASTASRQAAPPSPSPASEAATPPATPVATPVQETTPATTTTTTSATPATEATPSSVPAPPATSTPQPAPSSSPSTTPEQPAAIPEATPAASPTPSTAPTPAPKTASKTARKRGTANDGGACAVSASESAVEINKNGGSATITLSLANYAAAAPPRLNAATPNWADIILLAEAHTASDGNTFKYTITSVSQKTGTFVVTFTTPCGKQEVAVNVK
ncbi:MAG: tetratricopeptide repeat protein [Acidobacteria bacterium]|nr:tetratricopeptide repeat protein [Acidobacteriota bacterium]